MTSEALKQKFYEILFFNKEKYDTDDANFVIPYVSMNDGHTPAQIRYEDDGIYHDIPRSPFKRITGKIGEDGKIPDIDITSLVKYGSLEQAKIAPTLENVDIKLYFREPNLKKVKNNTKNTGLYADSYVWREAQPGFHLYNNDTLYGYEWIVVQDEHSSMDGVYNLQMNIEDGLGICKLAGTQAPISLKGVQYKVIITAKNLWTREYSLMEDTFPILTNLDTDSDDFAPSLNAVKKYYREKVVTKNAVVDEALTVAEKTTIDENGVNTNSIKTKDIEVEGKEIVYKEDLSDHINNTVKNPAKDEKDELRGPHGIANEGIDGNIDAKTLDGLELGTGARSVTQNKKFPAYIPFVDEDNFIGFGNDFGFFTKRNSRDEPATKLANLNLVAGRAPINSVMQDAFVESLKINGADFSGFVKTLVISNENFNIAYVPGNTPTIEITSGVAFSNNVEVKVGTVSAKSMITDSLKIGSATLDKDNILPLLNGSSIAYKRVISELLPYNVKEAASSYLEPNLKYDADGELVHGLETMDIEGNNLLVSPDLKNHIPTDSEVLSKDKTAFDKLGSALQAIYEMPMASYVYKRGQNEYKQQLGILIERVNQIRDTIAEARGSDIDEFNPKNYVVHKRNSMVKSSVRNVGSKKSEGVGALTEDRVLQNVYTYSDEEIKSIIHYLDLTTSKKELQQEIRNTVGILLKAAKETQERLLNVETSIFGWDSPTIPGPSEDMEAFINSHIDESLRDSINNSSMLLGLNRLVRAICLELFDTADLERIEAEEESRVTDTENSKVSVKTRMDQIDEVMSVLYNQSSAVVKYYMENVINDEAGHSYVDMYTAKNAQIISEEGQEEADLKIDGESHDLYKDSYDEGRKWKNLASKEELSDASKAEVGFAQVSKNAHKHSPNESETGIVRIPSVVKKNSEDISEGEIEHEDISKYLENNKVLRNWQLFKVDKTKSSIEDDYAANGTYAPIFKSKLVAWESAKVERMNLKLSELTKAVYGVDDTVASFPNRTEVLRRNITNLVDDLYPNRSFSVEHKVDIQGDATAEIYKPFKKSNKTLSENFESGKLVSKENPSVDEGSLETHKSIIPYFDSEIFNFTVENHFRGKGLKTGKAGSEYKEGKQIDMSTQNKIIFKTDDLVTDEIPFNDKYGTYHNAFSRIDMLEDILGVENAYISSLYEDNILSTGDYLNVLSGPAAGIKEQKVADYKKEISIYSYEISRIESDIKNIEEFLNSYLVNWTAIDGEILKKKADKSSVESKIKDNEEETESLKLSNAELLNSINSTETSLNTAEDSLREKEEEKGKTEEDIEYHETQISNLKATLDMLRDAMDEASTQVGKDRLVEEYNTLSKNLNDLINEKDDLSNELIAIKNAIVELNKQIDSLKETLSGLESQNSGVSSKLNELTEELNSLNAEKSQIEAKIIALETDKKNLEDKKVSQETKLEELKKDKESAESSLETARANLATSSCTNNALPYFVGELNFLDFSVVVDNKPAGPNVPSLSLLSSTDVSFVLSRKSKRIQERMTTAEAFLDSLTQGLHYGNYLLKTLEEQSESKSTKDINERFEQTEVKNILKRICEASELKQTGNSVFDLDLSESFEGCEEHNRKVWQRVPYSLNVTKSNYTTESDGITGKYEIKGKLVADPDLFPYGEEKYRLLKGAEWTIHVNYVSSMPNELDKDTIYLKLKVSDNSSLYSKFVKAEDVPVTPNVLNSDSFQNQTEYNIYKTLKNLFTSLFTLKNEEQNLYYQMMLRAHPVGSVFATFDNNFNPATQFGGTWAKLNKAVLYSGNSANPDFTNIATENISHKHSYAFNKTFSGSVANHSHSYIQNELSSPKSYTTGGSAPGCSVNVNVDTETYNNSTQNSAYILNVWVRTGAL